MKIAYNLVAYTIMDRILTKLKTALLGSLVILGMIFSAGALATPIVVDIDFRAGDWDDANTENSFTFDGLTATAIGGDGGLWQDSTDGLGIRGGEDDEIDGAEILKLTFDIDFYDSHGAITGVWLTDLFRAPDGLNFGETGIVTIWGVGGDVILGMFSFHQFDPTGNGEFYVDFGGAFDIFRMEFRGAGENGYGLSGSEYSVAGLTTSVPEPGTLALFGVGLLMVGFAGRRRLRPSAH